VPLSPVIKTVERAGARVAPDREAVRVDLADGQVLHGGEARKLTRKPE